MSKKKFKNFSCQCLIHKPFWFVLNMCTLMSIKKALMISSSLEIMQIFFSNACAHIVRELCGFIRGLDKNRFFLFLQKMLPWIDCSSVWNTKKLGIPSKGFFFPTYPKSFGDLADSPNSIWAFLAYILSMCPPSPWFSINQSCSLQKTKIFRCFEGISIWVWGVDFGCKEFGFKTSCVRSPC